jgi:hypothetical protein
MKTLMFKHLRSALFVLPLLAAGALAGCTAQVGAPEETTTQGEGLVASDPVVPPTTADPTQIQAAPIRPVLEGRTKPRSVNPIDPDQVQNGNGSDPDPSPWVETPGSTDPDPSPWMKQSSAAAQTK